MQIRVRSAILGLGVVAGLLAGLAALLPTIELGPLAGWYASRLAARPVTVASAQVGWSGGLSLELRGVRIANPDWATAPDLLRIEAVSAVIAPGSLLDDALRVTRLVLRRPALRLERKADGTPNWRPEGVPPGPADPAEKRRTQPILLDVALQDGVFVYRGTSGSELRLDVQQTTLRADGDEAPVSLALAGRYNGIAVRVEATGDAFAVLRDATRPYGTRVTLTTPASSLAFAGTMTAPLDLDGTQGDIQVETRALGELLAMLGLDMAGALPVALDGRLDRQGDHWRVTAARGRVAGSGFDGELALDEGARGAPDALAATLRFPQLDLKPILTALASGSGADLPLRIDPRPGVTLDAHIAAARLTAFGAAGTNLEMRARLLPGEALLDGLDLTLAGGRFAASLSARAKGAASQLVGRALLTGSDAAQLARLAGLATSELAGRLDAGIALDATAATLSGALPAARGHAVIAMTRGRVTRDLLETVSTDLRSLFRRGEGWADLRCLLGVAELRDGQAVISPLRLRTADTSLSAAGQAALLERRLDLTLKSGRAPGLFALQVPLRLRGPFNALEAQPQLGSAADWLDMPERNAALRRLPPELARLTQGNPCVT